MISEGKRRRRHIYGPVPSRRLGRSLGVDLVPFKTCTYDCIYCQLGKTTAKTAVRRPYVPVEPLVEEIRTALDRGPTPDYITLSGSGEPTLHSDLGRIIRSIGETTDIPLAVITNGSLLWDGDVRAALRNADLLIPSLDGGNETLFRKINRPCRGISFRKMLDGLVRMREEYPGRLWLEVFLVAGMNDGGDELQNLKNQIDRIAPDRVQLNTNVRSPARTEAPPVDAGTLNDIARSFGDPWEVVAAIGTAGVEGFSASGDREAAILEMIGRRPSTAEDIASGLGLAIHEIIKYLADAVSRDRIEPVETGTNIYYTLKR